MTRTRMKRKSAKKRNLLEKGVYIEFLATKTAGEEGRGLQDDYRSDVVECSSSQKSASCLLLPK